jgi:glycyl-tRNA synthetase
MAFYGDDAWDVEVNLNSFGWTECCGVHDRTDYDLKQHAKFSGQELVSRDEKNEKKVPHVLEIAFGSDRPTFALLDIFYAKKEKEEGKTIFAVPYHLSPVEVAVLPLLKKPELMSLADEIVDDLRKKFVVQHDVSAAIGKRYLRQDSIGTPYCITVDFDSLENDDVTVRDRDTTKQVRVKISELKSVLSKLIRSEISFADLE